MSSSGTRGTHHQRLLAQVLTDRQRAPKRPLPRACCDGWRRPRVALWWEL